MNFSNPDWIHVKNHWGLGGSKPVNISNFTVVKEPKKDSTGQWSRVIMSPNGNLYWDYYEEGGKHELRIAHRNKPKDPL